MAYSGKRSRGIATLGVVLMLLLAAAALLTLLRGAGNDGGTNAASARHVATAQNAALRVGDALDGSREAFDELARRRSSLPTAAAVATQFGADEADAARRSWGQFASALDSVIDGRDAVLAGHNAAASATQQLPRLATLVSNVAATLDGPGLRQAAPMVERFEVETRNVAQNLTALAAGRAQRSALVDRIETSNAFMDRVLRGFRGEDATLNLPIPPPGAATDLQSLSDEYADVAAKIRNAIDVSAPAEQAARAARQVGAAAQNMYALPVREVSSGGGLLSAVWLPLVPLVGAALAGLGLMFGRREVQTDQTELAAATEQNEANQQAILRLLDEMGSLADGDLTVEATVTEDITGAIADSINYAIEALRDLVSTIDGAASEVASTAQQTEAMAGHLAKSSENQSRQVFAATESIANMAGSIEEVSGNAERSADVARHSVEIAHKGAEAVRRTIDGMNTIRETIQDTSKRIKRLGESSQEIGNIVELINDIAEQTNILALNASIQASMAGEAGRGFAVVADEVQRLSERATNATRQIEVLVKTIQSDTNEAVVSMERSTTDVVSGALLAENAGASLDEIEKVSNQIAGLVQNISATARQQATAAADITRNMGVLQEISAQTAENTGAASRSIGKLAEMATELRRSVAGFTLPGKAPADGDGPVAKPRKADEADFLEADELLAEVGSD